MVSTFKALWEEENKRAASGFMPRLGSSAPDLLRSVC